MKNTSVEFHQRFFPMLLHTSGGFLLLLVMFWMLIPFWHTCIVAVYNVPFFLEQWTFTCWVISYSSFTCAKGECHLDVQSETRTRPDVIPPAKVQQEAYVHVLNAVKLILATVKRLWQLVICGCTDEVLKALRWWKGLSYVADCMWMKLCTFCVFDLVSLHTIFCSHSIIQLLVETHCHTYSIRIWFCRWARIARTM